MSQIPPLCSQVKVDFNGGLNKVKCPFCGGLNSSVLDSRMTKEQTATRRRRLCPGCGERFTTYETPVKTLQAVAKKNGQNEPFSREKLIKGIKCAFEKVSIKSEVIESIADCVEHELEESGEKEISSSRIGELVLKNLQEIDEVAYLRFASVHRDFKKIEEFVEEIKSMEVHREETGR